MMTDNILCAKLGVAISKNPIKSTMFFFSISIGNIFPKSLHVKNVHVSKKKIGIMLIFRV